MTVTQVILLLTEHHKSTGTCGHDPMVPLIAHPPFFFNVDFFFMYTTFCNFLCIYNKNNQTVVSIHTAFLTYFFMSEPGMDRKFFRHMYKYNLYTGQNPVWIETTVWLFLLYKCHTVIHRRLQNVVYMKKKKSMLKKRGKGNQRHHIGSCPQVPVHNSWVGSVIWSLSIK